MIFSQTRTLSIVNNVDNSVIAGALFYSESQLLGYSDENGQIELNIDFKSLLSDKKRSQINGFLKIP